MFAAFISLAQVGAHRVDTKRPAGEQSACPVSNFFNYIALCTLDFCLLDLLYCWMNIRAAEQGLMS